MPLVVGWWLEVARVEVVFASAVILAVAAVLVVGVLVAAAGRRRGGVVWVLVVVLVAGVVGVVAVSPVGRVEAVSGDGVELGFYRPSNGRWYVEGSSSVGFGFSDEAGIVPVPADYDGDGVDEFAFYRPANGRWYRIGDNSVGFSIAGEESDIVPVPADFDGDGADEFAFYRPSNGRWYVQGENSVGFGFAGETDVIPVPGDFDGDGADEFAFYRPANGRWYRIGDNSVGFSIAREESDIVPVPADFDGDGSDEFAFYRPSNGRLYVQGSSSVGFGFAGEADIVPVPGDYNGDGAAEFGFYRPANGRWYVQGQYSVGYSIAGEETDIVPTPRDFVPPVTMVDVTFDVLPGTTTTDSIAVAGVYVESVTVAGDDPAVEFTSVPSGPAVYLEATALLGAGPAAVGYVVDVVSCVEAADPCPAWSQRDTVVNVDVSVGELGVDTPDEVLVPSADRWVEDTDGVKSVPAERVLLAADGAASGDIVALVEANGGTVVGQNPRLGIYQLRFDSETTAAAADGVLGVSVMVETVGPYAGIPDGLAQQPGDDWINDGPDKTWTFDVTNAPAAWDRETGESSVHIGVMDAGIYTEHDDLIGNTIRGQSYTPAWGTALSNWEIQDDGAEKGAHGTHVAGTICADQNDDGLVGVMWDCTLHALDLAFMTDLIGWEPALLSEELDRWLLDAEVAGYPIRVVNLSWNAGAATDQANGYFEEVFTAHDNVLFVVAAGNEDGADAAAGVPRSLGYLPNVVVVGSHTDNHVHSDFSNIGAEVAAPGGNRSPTLGVWSTTHSCVVGVCYDTYGSNDTYGTSMSAPFVTGVAGLMLSHRPSLTVDEVASCLTGDAATFPIDGGDGVRGIDVNAALNCAETTAAFKACANQTSIPAIECQALVELYRATDGVNWQHSDGWLSDPDPANWYGVSIGGSNPGYVRRISLGWNTLRGELPVEIGNFANLNELSLRANALTGPIPAEIGNLTNLTKLDLGGSAFSGDPYWIHNNLTSIPAEIGNLTNLTELKLGGNHMSGAIPAEIGNLTNLTKLDLGSGNWDYRFTSLPPEIGNLTNLTELILYRNELVSLPPEIGNLTNLTELDLESNELTSLPTEIGNLIHVTDLDLYGSHLTSLPSGIGGMSSLTRLNLNGNSVASLPSEIGSLTSLVEFDLAANRLAGLPPEIGNLVNLTSLGLATNGLASLPPEIGNLVNLTSLGLTHNDLTTLPAGIGNLTKLTALEFYGSHLTSLPPEIGNLVNLTSLGLTYNDLTTLPPEFGNLVNLPELDLRQNALAFLPLEIGNLTNLTSLYLAGNSLTALPGEIGNLTNLATLSVSNNQLAAIPPELGGISSLWSLSLSDNMLTEVPNELGDLSNLINLYLSRNMLSGTIPSPILRLSNLSKLYLDENGLSGEVPAELVDLPNLYRLYLRGQTGCLTAADSTFADWLTYHDAYWNDGCAP